MGSFRQLYYQIVFCPKYRAPVITEAFSSELYSYISGILQVKKSSYYHVNGIEDHIHIFCDIHPTIALSDFIKDIKVASNLWMKESGKFPDFSNWQDGYAAFTYSSKDRERVANYVKNQKQHHRKETFNFEYQRLLKENRVKFDERYLF